jgi:cysteine desulfurase/selenocysteine lyase
MLDQWKPVFAGAHTDQTFDLDKGVFETRRSAPAVEYGTRSTPVTIGLGAAIDFLTGLGMDRVAERGHALATRLKDALATLPAVDVLTPATPDACAAIVTFRMRNTDLTPGPWCQRLKSKFRLRLRPVTEHGLNAIRACTHVFNSEAEVDRLIDVVTTLTRPEPAVRAGPPPRSGAIVRESGAS